MAEPTFIDVQRRSRRSLQTVQHAGKDRLVLTLDPGATARRRVIVSLHGSGFTSRTHNAMVGAADLSRGGALVLTPEALIPFRYSAVFPEGFGWNVPRCLRSMAETTT